MGQGPEITASGGSENIGVGSRPCKAHDVSVSPEKDRGGTAGQVGKGEVTENVVAQSQ